MLERWSGGPATTRPPAPGSGPTPLDRHKLPLTALCAVLLVLGLALWLVRAPTQQPVVVPTTAPGPRVVAVHVVGAVARPGLYELADGARTADALAAAGGALPAADAARLNLALRLRDGQQLVVPTAAAPSGEAEASPRAARPAAPRAGAPVNLNQASQAELEALPGVGPVTARKILEHRERHGPFGSTDELTAARLVSNATWQRIRELVEAP